MYARYSSLHYLCADGWRVLRKTFLLHFAPRTVLHAPPPPPDAALKLTAQFPTHLLAGSAERGRAWLAGNVNLPGAVLTREIKNPLSTRPPNKAWAASLHSFSWLAHLLALNSKDGDEAAKAAILAAIENMSVRHRIAWQGDVAAIRFVHFCAAAPHVLPLLTKAEKQKFIHALHQHAHFLQKLAHLESDGMARLTAICGFAYSAFALSGGIGQLHVAMHRLNRELGRQVLEDGVHISRSPDALLPVLPILIAIGDEMRRRELPMPNGFAAILKNATRSLAFFLHGDKGFALFHGSTQSDMARAVTGDYVKKLMGAAGVKRAGRNRFLSSARYHRLSAGRSLLFFDAGLPALHPSSPLGHFSPLALEFSRGTKRVLVNCGPNLVHGPDWRQASRGAAAHSMLSVSGAELSALSRNKGQVTARRLEDNNGQWLEASHALFKPICGMVAHRRIYLSTDGEDLRVEELLLPATNNNGARAVDYALRLHLHPDMRASMAADGKTILLMTPSGEGWQFRAGKMNHARLALADSVYMGRDGTPRKARQIVIDGRAEKSGLSLNWALKLSKRN